MAKNTLTPARVATLKTFVNASIDATIVDARTRGDTILLAASRRPAPCSAIASRSSRGTSASAVSVAADMGGGRGVGT